ncbi:acyl-CoA synthetase [Gordonia spumicola]|uniref:Acyl-CoA synthetase n=1 Tax=Gordonia spumicola TaxID=589161 RepID=A0A7I9VAF5_9ACTN|nr:fatty-acid--CoA ligase FadD1 [Gordonia spumicola]GEE02358.1 acyl-CoA synthetase [Gordonia spumicola]
MAQTLQELIAERAETPGVAVRFAHRDTGDTVEWSWPEYIGRARRHAAAVIARLDDARPPHVAALLGNTPDMLVALAGAAEGGYVLCGVNDTRRGSALAGDIARSDSQLLLVDAEHRDLLTGLDLPGVVVVDVDSRSWAREAEAAGDLTPVRTVEMTDPFMMIFTSGTSGDPKAVLVSHLMVLFAGTNLVERFGLTADDVFYLSMPLFHSNAIAGGFSPAVNAGGTLVPTRFSASRFVDDLRRFGVTYMNYVGKPLSYVLATPPRPDDADNPLRIAFGNEASERDIGEFARRFDVHVTDAFGSTENAVIITRDETTPPGSIGRGLPGVEVYHPDTSQPCAPAVFDEHRVLVNPDDAIGELVNTSGAGFFSGYYNNPDANAERMRGGMYWSGDLAYADTDGYLYLAGRTSDWLRVDGENLTAAPIERILMRLDAVSRVAVYATHVPESVGDEVMAALVLRDDAALTPEEFGDFLAAQDDLSPKAWPRFVRVASDLPSTATNKILKRSLVADGRDVGDDVLWTRGARSRTYS